MKNDLRKGILFQADIDVKRPRDLADFLRRSQKYIDYEEDILASKAVAKPNSEKDLEQK